MTRDSQIERSAGGFTVPAELVAEAFGLDPSTVPTLMRTGAITSLSETGEGADAGRERLTFFHAGRALRLTLDAEGAIIGKARFDAPGRGVAGVRKDQPGTE